MANKQLMLPANRAFNSNGLAISGAQAKLYITGTSTPANFYADSGLITSLGSTITANGAGRFPTAYQNEITQFRLKILDSDGAVLDDIDPFNFGYLPGATGPQGITGPAGDVAKAADRTALAAIAGATAATTRYLAESGREGAFVFDSSNLSAKVTADTAQGVYVAPASDTTGASGAWVRSFASAVSVKWFGATGDGVTNDSAAFTAAIAFLKATGVNLSTNTFYKGSHKLLVPAGHYYMGTTTLEISHTLIVEGEGTSGSTTSKLRWADSATGIRIQRYNTSGASTVDGVTHTGGDNTTIRGLYLLGGYTSTEGEYHGIHTKGRIIVEDCLIEQWSGDGVFANTTAGSGGANEGNSNLTNFARVIVQTCRNGFNLDGADENVWKFDSCQGNANRAWGFKDSNFLGNTYLACHAATNGAASATIPTGVTQTSNHYMVVPGQETWCSTNAPTGAATNNQGWLWIGAGSVSAGYPAWVTGTTYRAGGSYFSDDANAQSLYAGCYSEGDQNPAYVAAPAMFIGGQHALKPFGNAVYLRTDTSGFLQLGPIIGTGRDYEVDLNSTGTYNKILFNSWAGGVSTTDATLWSIKNGGFIIDAPQGLNLRFNGSSVATVDTGAINLASGKVLQHNGTALTSGATIVAPVATAGAITSTGGGIGYATGAGGTVTQATSKATGVTLNKLSGQITLNNAALASAAKVSFVVTNSLIAGTDLATVGVASGGTANAYRAAVTAVAAGSFTITVENITAGSLSEAPVLNFAIIKAVAA